jgi:hypothetical protein
MAWVRRLNCTVASTGELVDSETVYQEMESRIEAKPSLAEKDWYTPFFVYPKEEAEAYYKSNGNSMAGYDGTVVTTAIYWDIDCEELETAKADAIKLIDFLLEMGYAENLHIYFSGNKGFHITLPVSPEHQVTPIQTKTIAQNIANKIGIVVDQKVYDSVRLMRMRDTKHQKSGYYKIEIEAETLFDGTIDEIKKLASEPQGEIFNPNPIDPTDLIVDYGQVAAIEIDTFEQDEEDEYIKDIRTLKKDPSQRRQCIVNMEDGYIPPGVSNASITRLAVNHKHEGFSLEDSIETCIQACANRTKYFPDANSVPDREIIITVKHIYKNHRGGIYTCGKDEILTQACSLGESEKCQCRKSRYMGKSIHSAGMLVNRYLDYSNELLEEFPQIGIEELDLYIRLRPKNYTVLAAANGSGKTSVMLQMMENLNKQKIPHIVFSMDMADSSIFEKLAARFTPYTQKEVENAFSPHTRDPEILQEIAYAVSDALPYSLFNFESTVTVSHIEKVVNGFNSEREQEDRIQVVFIDYAGRLASEKDSDFAAASHNAKRANDVAKTTNTHLFILSQVPREKGDQSTPIRTNRAAKSAGDWEENATTVITMWRPLARPEFEGQDNYIAFYIGKNRSGTGLERHLHWDGKTGTIRSLTNDEYVAYTNLCAEEGVSKPPFRKGLSVDLKRRNDHRTDDDD